MLILDIHWLAIVAIAVMLSTPPTSTRWIDNRLAGFVYAPWKNVASHFTFMLRKRNFLRLVIIFFRISSSEKYFCCLLH